MIQNCYGKEGSSLCSLHVRSVAGFYFRPALPLSDMHISLSSRFREVGAARRGIGRQRRDRRSLGPSCAAPVPVVPSAAAAAAAAMNIMIRYVAAAATALANEPRGADSCVVPHLQRVMGMGWLRMLRGTEQKRSTALMDKSSGNAVSF
jgi:hypothetical protein